jgi:hypothetical protein
MKYAFFTEEEAAKAAMKTIEDALGITEGDFGFPKGIINRYRTIREIDGRWGFPVYDSGPAKADHLVDTEEYEPEEYEPEEDDG